MFYVFFFPEYIIIIIIIIIRWNNIIYNAATAIKLKYKYPVVTEIICSECQRNSGVVGVVSKVVIVTPPQYTFQNNTNVSHA